MSLLKRMQQLMDMDNPKDEVNRKVVSTFCLINGSPENIMGFDYTNNIIKVSDDWSGDMKKIPFDKDTKFEFFNPKPGLYNMPGGIVMCLNRLARRQYYKSYNHHNYVMSFLYANESNKKIKVTYNTHGEILKDIAKIPVREIAVDGEGFIWYWDYNIGYVKNSNSVVCTNEHFVQELSDWSRDA